MPRRWYAPVDPECPEVKEWIESTLDDPILNMSGIGSELTQDFENSHRVKCKRCQEYGAANIEVR